MARILGESGTLVGREWKIDPGLTMGREAHNTIAMPDNKKSSRDHAKVFRESPGKYSIVDLGSTNGTLVNDEGVKRHALVDGDEIRIGEWVFRFVLDDDEKPKPKEPPVNRLADALGRAPAAAPGTGAPGSRPPGAAPSIEVKSRILQYSKKEAKGGVAGWDLSQTAGGTKWVLYLIVLAVAAGLFFLMRSIAGG